MGEKQGLSRDERSGIERCWWCVADPNYIHYHDEEWGRPVVDDVRLFEKMILEGFQAGLSWLTILRKRENFRQAFAGFDFRRVAQFGSADIARLLKDAGIVRHRGKIASTINNARQALRICDEFTSLASYFWSFEPSDSPLLLDRSELVSQNHASRALSKDLKQRGWTFVGPTTCYAFMQAMGMVNDHIHGCVCWQAVDNARAQFKRPAS